MDINIIRIKRSTANKAYIFLLLPVVMLSTSIKNALSIAILAALFTAVSYGIILLINKYLSKAIVYPTILTVLGALVFLTRFIPIFYGFVFRYSATSAMFFTLFLLKYLNGKKQGNKILEISRKYAQISICIVVLGAFCEFLSFGKLFGIKIHSHPVTFFCSTTGILLILSVFAVLINLFFKKKININKSFCFGQGSIKLVLYSALTALIAVFTTRALDSLLLSKLNASYLSTIIICFVCGVLAVVYKLIDKRIHIGRTAVNVIPSIALLISLTVFNTYSDYKKLLFRFAVYTAIFALSAFFCRYANRKNDTNNPLTGAPATLMFFAIASLMIDYLRILL